jgi:hypothetical protein
MKKVYKHLVGAIAARANCEKSGNSEWSRTHRERADALAAEHLPNGSGVDSGSQIDWDKSSAQMIVINTSYHHMNEHGMYDGWTEHQVCVTASLLFDLNIRITGEDRNEIKEYLHEIFNEALMREVEEIV